VIILPQRDPILLAKQAAGVDQLSDGRLVLGVGVGWMREQYQYLRTDFSRRGRMADEWIRAMRVLWNDDPCSFHGEHVAFDDAYFQPKPVQRGGPPVHVGGASAAALRRAATLGDGWHASALGLDQFGRGVDQLRQFGGGRALTVSLRGYVALGRYAERHPDDPDYLFRGPPSMFVERINAYRQAGLAEFICSFAYETVDDILVQVDQFAAEVMPALHG
jgi:probable F420-dependent oxidoreductase